MVYKTDWFEIVKKQRKALGLNQEEIASVLGIQRSRYSTIESGQSYLNDIQFLKLLFLLRLSPYDLLDEFQESTSVIHRFLDASFKLVYKFQENESEEIEQFISEQNQMIYELLKG